MDIKIEEREIEVDVVNNPMFHWTDTLNIPQVVDWNQLQYQNTYKSLDYVASKFTGDFSHLPGFDKIIQNVAMKTTSPLDELLSRYKVVDEYKEDGDDTNLFEFQNRQ